MTISTESEVCVNGYYWVARFSSIMEINLFIYVIDNTLLHMLGLPNKISVSV